MSRVQEFQYIAKNILFYTFFKYNEHVFLCSFNKASYKQQKLKWIIAPRDLTIVYWFSLLYFYI